MERFPNEIHYKVFRHLDSKDKLTCLLVSRDWSSWIKPCLFDNFTIQDPAKLSIAIAYFSKHKDIAKHVRHLEISNFAEIYKYAPHFQQLFPNLTTINLEAASRVYAFKGQVLKTGTWNNLQKIETLEYMYDVGPLMVELILYNYCPNVIELSIQFSAILPIARNDRLTRVFNLLKNAPQLAKVSLTSVHYSISDLETLHKNAPQLRSLTLNHSRFSPTVIERIEPTYMNSLTISLTEDNEESIVNLLVGYIVKKYKGLVKMSITADTKSVICSGYDEQELLPLIANCPQLSHYNQIIYPLTETITKAIGRSRIQLEEIVLYVNKETVVSQCHALLDSTQRNSIKSLNIVAIDDSSFDEELTSDGYGSVEITALGYLKLMNKITNLVFNANDKKPMCLTLILECLSHMPQLLNISLQNVCIQTKEVPAISIPFQIKQIEITSLKIASMEQLGAANKVMQSLLPYCPNLERFKLMIDIRSVSWGPHTSRFTMVLDFTYQINLKTTDITLKRNKSQYFHILNGSTTSGYFLHDGDRFDRKDAICHRQYFTTIVLPRSVLLNSNKV